MINDNSEKASVMCWELSGQGLDLGDEIRIKNDAANEPFPMVSFRSVKAIDKSLGVDENLQLGLLLSWTNGQSDLHQPMSVLFTFPCDNLC